jgi:hypothetical protein
MGLNAVAVCFPSLLGFSGSRLLEFGDKELALAIRRAYNDWVFDGWCAAAPDLYIPMVIVPLWDPQLAADEVRRTAARGARCITLPEDPGGLGLGTLWDGSWNPLWEALSETAWSSTATSARPATSPSRPGRRSTWRSCSRRSRPPSAW